MRWFHEINAERPLEYILEDIMWKIKNPSSYDFTKKAFFCIFSDSDNIPNDSGLASSVDESVEEHSKKVDKKSKKGLKKGSKDKKFEENSTVGQIHQADLIFNLDF